MPARATRPGHVIAQVRSPRKPCRANRNTLVIGFTRATAWSQPFMKWIGTWPVDRNIELNPKTWIRIIERIVRKR